jgi:hypothetical protein
MMKDEGVQAIIKSKTLRVTYRGLEFNVRAMKYQWLFGRNEFLIEPVSGTGKAWISVNHLTIDNIKGAALLRENADK